MLLHGLLREKFNSYIWLYFEVPFLLHNKYIKLKTTCTKPRNTSTGYAFLHWKCTHCLASFVKVKFQGGCAEKIKIKYYKHVLGCQCCVHYGDFGKRLIVTFCNRKRNTYFVRNQKHCVFRFAHKFFSSKNVPYHKKYGKLTPAEYK